MSQIKVLSVNVSEEKGTIKISVPSIELCETGIKNDAHSGKWHRMVSLLGNESIEKFSAQAGRAIAFGEFAENITTEGLLLYEIHPLDKISNATVELEVTQIGKECHGDSCAIFREVGNCVMPKEGIFARVIRGGELKAGDILEYHPKIHNIHVITLSDRAYAGEYEDRSGPAVVAKCEEFLQSQKRHFNIERTVIPDDADMLESLIAHLVNSGADAIFTTGGTGVSSKDITPETIHLLLDKELPGIMEMIRWKYGQHMPAALLSRSIAGTIGKTQVYCMPGSVKAVNEYMHEILKTYHHLMLMLHGIDAH